MAKITSFMRVTKQPKAHGKKVDASSAVKKQHVTKDVVVEKEEAAGRSEDETGAHIPTFIYEVSKAENLETSLELGLIIKCDFDLQTVKYAHKHQKHEVAKELKTIIEYIKVLRGRSDAGIMLGTHSVVLDSAEVL
ncbi:unnamed protein product [Phytophthora lilii]|uniref:Unnamed protein product n=1 Tax=Phytophthora lilii TaxID=2077276 RepID=A0A9W6U5B4_9STRA|nr:unnamed protein product [Phytophthora lilii]